MIREQLILQSSINELLLSQIQTDNLILSDNLLVHLPSKVEAMVATRKGQVLWSPSYSPDLSPVEPFWSKDKTSVPGKEPCTEYELNIALML
jgi:transposase